MTREDRRGPDEDEEEDEENEAGRMTLRRRMHAYGMFGMVMWMEWKQGKVQHPCLSQQLEVHHRLSLQLCLHPPQYH